jgi:hypothetical protein
MHQDPRVYVGDEKYRKIERVHLFTNVSTSACTLLVCTLCPLTAVHNAAMLTTTQRPGAMHWHQPHTKPECRENNRKGLPPYHATNNNNNNQQQQQQQQQRSNNMQRDRMAVPASYSPRFSGPLPDLSLPWKTKPTTRQVILKLTTTQHTFRLTHKPKTYDNTSTKRLLLPIGAQIIVCRMLCHSINSKLVLIYRECSIIASTNDFLVSTLHKY